ncbi:MAG: LPS export ABC transporter periplasmic protein LptC [Bacteroidetes bacterium]|jgi:LPS export ABC transporter protein LptC|nr:LPS export ABC transporter periplasmic protein LptC [Bacteroidota bacterium]MDA0972240.1 LPS export ABC transporter periplasmic protein LptC [Bacteroidota bacterium]
MAIVIGIFCFSCKNDIGVIQEIGEESLGASQTVYNVTYTYTDSGRVRNILHAGKLEQFVQDTDYVKVSQGLSLIIKDRSERESGRLTSDTGLYLKAQNEMRAIGGVIFTNPKGDSLFTDHLTWYSDSSLILTDAPVRILRADGLDLKGKGLRAKEDFSRYTILAPFGDIAVPDNLNTSNEAEEDQ